MWNYFRRYIKFIVIVFSVFIVVITSYIGTALDNIIINEVCSNNFSVSNDENGEYLDYIELYNPSLIRISLNGYYLSDEVDMLKKYSLEDATVDAKGHCIIYVDNK